MKSLEFLIKEAQNEIKAFINETNNDPFAKAQLGTMLWSLTKLEQLLTTIARSNQRAK